jgi:hypothetical protein
MVTTTTATVTLAATQTGQLVSGALAVPLGGVDAVVTALLRVGAAPDHARTAASVRRFRAGPG